MYSHYFNNCLSHFKNQMSLNDAIVFIETFGGIVCIQYIDPNTVELLFLFNTFHKIILPQFRTCISSV